jgi:hypothetical protein
MKYCPNCGDEVEEGDAYCYECGQELPKGGVESSETRRGEEVSADKDSEDTEDVEEDSGSSRYPVLSVFASVMLFWGAFWSFNNSPNPYIDAALMAVAGYVIIPRVRNSAVAQLREETGIDLHSRPALWSLLRISVGTLYVLLVAAAAMLMVGGAANDPNMSPWAGVGSIVIAFVIAVVAVAISPPIEDSDPEVDSSDGGDTSEAHDTAETHDIRESNPEPDVRTAYEPEDQELFVMVEHPGDSDSLDVKIDGEVKHTFNSPEPGDSVSLEKSEEESVSIKKRKYR